MPFDRNGVYIPPETMDNETYGFREEPAVEPVPDVPQYRRPDDVYRGVESATPDLILFDDNSLPVDIMTELLFENVGGQELISLVRNDIINGQDIRYNIIANLGLLNQEYNPRNIFRISGTLNDFFENFAISLSEKVPEKGTGPALFYVGAEGTNGCTGFPVLNRYDDTLIQCFDSLVAAQQAINNDLAPYRDIVYSSDTTGDIVVDVVNLKNNELVEIEVITSLDLENDTIY